MATCHQMLKLSEVLDRYYVLPFGQSEIVGWYYALEEDDVSHVIVVEWADIDRMETYNQEFYDQPIRPMSNTTQGMFAVTTTDGETVAFIALTGANLEE